jgi:uncharacterized membrane protein YedE/YeeE
MKWLPIVGILVIVVGSAWFYRQFQNHMVAVEQAKRDASAMGYFSSADRELAARHDAFQRKEAEHRSAATGSFFSGVGVAIAGAGLIGLGWYLGRKA